MRLTFELKLQPHAGFYKQRYKANKDSYSGEQPEQGERGKARIGFRKNREVLVFHSREFLLANS